MTLTLQGSDFTPQTVVSLESVEGGTPVDAQSVDAPNGSALDATFNLGGVALGAYDVVVSNGGPAITAPGSFTVETGSPGQVVFSLAVPSVTSYLRQEFVTVNYTNIGDTDAPAPLLSLVGNDVAIRLPDDTSFDSSGAVQFLAIDANGPAGILPPGFSGSISIPFYSTTKVGGTAISFNLYEADEYEVVSPGSTDAGQVVPAIMGPTPLGETPVALDWSSVESTAQPAGISAAAWNSVWTNFVAEAGDTAPQFLSVLDNLATYLGDIGSLDTSEVDFNRLYGMLINEAAGNLAGPTLAETIDTDSPAPDLSLGIDRSFMQSIEGRGQSGMFGLGWTTSWDTWAVTDAQGDIDLVTPYSDESFTIQSDGTFQAEPGNLDTLTVSGGDYLVTMPNGSVNAFLVSTGALDYEADSDGNKVTAGYNAAGQLISLSHSDGQVLTLSYNAQGFVDQVTDPEQRVYQYAYTTGGNLLSVTGPQGTTTYTYDAGPGPAANALESVTSPGGVVQTFSYNSQGWLSGSNVGGTEAGSVSYVSPFGVTVTDADGNSTTTLYNDSLQPAKEIDGLGDVTSFSYDDFGNLTKIVSPQGETSTLTYDAAGDLTSATDPLGQTVSYSNDAATGELTGVTNGNGYTTTYAYNAQGNLLSIAYPDGSAEQFQYDPEGNMTETIDQEGNPTNVTYNAYGQATIETFADGTSTTYTYDADGNMVTATDASGTTTLSYNGADELTEVAYPGGQFLKFTYDAAGNRTQSVDQDGFTVNYQYDAADRLTGLTNGSGAAIVTYTYDPAGLLVKETMGNGTYTTYTYNQAEELTDLVNDAPGGAVNSQFAYTYNPDGEVTSMTTAAGTTTYGYDADGELISVAAPGGPTITYTYDADGNRTSETEGGVTTAYTINDMDEVTAAGATTYGYDPDGDLLSATDGGSTTTYSYNDESQLTGVSGPAGTYTYQYDALGNLSAETVNGQQTTYLVDPTGLGTVVAQYESSALTANFTYGLGLVSQVSAAGASSYYDFDGSGNTVGITGAAGTYVNQYSYLPFGETTTVKAALANLFTFEGVAGVVSDGSGLVLSRARAYLPATGQFTTADPTGLAGGSVNLRAYAANDPVSLADPSGLSCQSDIQNEINQLASQMDQLEAREHQILVNLAQIQSGAAAQAAGAMQAAFGEPSVSTILSQLKFRGAFTFQQAHPQAAALLQDPASYEANVQAKLTQVESQLDALSNQIAQLEKQQANCPKNPGPNKQKLPKFPYCSVPVQPKSKATPNALVIGPDAATSGGMSGCSGAASGGGENVGSNDPNDIIGPAGYGAQGFVPIGGPLPYTIQFTNDATASAPAQVVTVTDSLSSSLDWATFQLGSFGFGGITVSVPPGRTSFSTEVDDRAADGVYVDVSANFDPQTGVVTWTFTSIDPTTLDQPSNLLEGFLPPDRTSPEGEGFVNYTVQPKSGDPTGTVINASASVVFDNNSPVVTTPITNTIDAGPPTSTVAALPADVLANFPVSWSGQGDAHGSGIASYNVFASEDGGPFVLWQADTTQTSATFNGEAGNTYAFYSVATDNAGNIQALPAAAQATTTAVAPAVLVFSTSLYQVNENAGFASVTVTRSGNLSTTATVDFTTAGGTAVAGVQYTTVSMSLSFAPGVTSQVVEIPIHDNLVHGGDLFVDMSLSAPSAVAALGPIASAVLDIHQNDAPLVTVLNVSIQKETLKKHQKVTVIVLQFSGALNAPDAQNRLLYSLAPETTKKHVLKLGKPVAPATAIYNASTNTVTLTPKKALVLNPPEQLKINSSGLLDALGRALDGNNDGVPGGNFVATLSKQGITLQRLGGQSASRLAATAVDHLLEKGALRTLPSSRR